nr:MAG TPA: Double-stranded RNA binding domain 2 [Caudoviricetes sp.]
MVRKRHYVSGFFLLLPRELSFCFCRQSRLSVEHKNLYMSGMTCIEKRIFYTGEI